MKTGGASTLKRLEIKKYANRRYYDTTHSRHLTLEEIRALIQKGHDIRVVDARTSADITPQVLTQIILELETPKLDSFPVSLLLRVIRVNDTVVKDFIEKYFNQAFQTFVDYQKTFEEQLRKTHGLPSGLPGFPDWPQSMFNPFAATPSSPPEPSPENPPAPSRPSSEDTKAMLAMIQDLRNEIAGLKSAVPESRPRRKKKKAAGKSGRAKRKNRS